MTNPTPPSNTDQNKGFWRSLILWAVLALLLRWYVLEPRWIPSGSMLPTLQLQDRILVEKVRPRVQRIQHRHLHRNDVVVFEPPEALIVSGYDANAALIKRLVGLPGDVLAVANEATKTPIKAIENLAGSPSDLRKLALPSTNAPTFAPSPFAASHEA